MHMRIAAVPWRQACLSSAYAALHAVYQLNGWIKAWFIYSIIAYSVISGLPLEPRCLDNQCSTLSPSPTILRTFILKL